ncbi:MAG: endonuclease III, partial [Alphaproteobacteria bacterium]|nr:endonuclease III [Alphaproteobacteria bacterium]
EYTNTYTLLVAVALSAQTTDKGVNKATKELFQYVSHPKDMLALGEDALINHIKTIGLYRTKAKNMIKMAQILVDQFEGEVPNNRDALESLPGVGRKTANVVLNIAFGLPTLAVDTHILRVSNRLNFVQAKTPLACEKQLEQVIPKDYFQNAHHWLILHGRYICKAIKPQCPTCPIRQYCSYMRG